ncbi:MAG: hypothetical protein AAF988_07240 [Pseudomonadota bacterium]
MSEKNVNLKDVLTAIFEQGTIKTKNGQLCPAKHALNVLQALVMLEQENLEALAELKNASATTRISAGTKEALKSHVSILTSVDTLGPTTIQIIQDTVSMPLRSTPHYNLEVDTTFYETQFEEKAGTKGAIITFQPGFIPRVSPAI